MNTFSTHTEIRCRREPWLCDAVTVHVAQISNRDGVRTVSLGLPMQFRVLTEKDMARQQEESFRLSPSDAQQFMDELWRAGIRPTAGAGSVGQLAATEKHLEDLRKIAFKKLSITP